MPAKYGIMPEIVTVIKKGTIYMGNAIRVRQRTYSGAVCEDKIFMWAPRGRDISKAKPKRQRFKTEEEQKLHCLLISKRKFARLVNANCSPTSLYSTLTFDNDSEVHTFEEAKQLRDLFLKRVRRKYPKAVIFLVMGRGKHTNRIHFHMLSEGLPEEYIRKQWKYGTIVRIENLREHNWYDGVDHGQDYTGLANYMFDHWTPEQGGHRWYMTRTARQPEAEEPKEVKRNYTEQKPPKPPKGYKLVDTRVTQYGYLYFKYVKLPSTEVSGRRGKADTGDPGGGW